jgi:hypothetical protein
MRLPTAVIPFKEQRAMKLARAAGVNPMTNWGRGDRVFGVPGRPTGIQVAGLGAYISGDAYGDGMLHSRYGPVGSGGYGPLKGLGYYADAAEYGVLKSNFRDRIRQQPPRSNLGSAGYGVRVARERYGPLLLGAYDQWSPYGETSRTSNRAEWPINIKLGNMSAALSDYINTPGTPGSSTFFLYGLGQDDSFNFTTALSPSDVAMSPDAAVTPSSSPSFWDSLTKVAQSAVQAAPAVLQVINQQNAVSALNAGKITPAQYQMLMTQPTATIALQPSAGLATGLKVGGGTIALLGAGALALLLLRKRR